MTIALSTYSLALPLHYLRNAYAHSPTLRAIIGAADEAAALTSTKLIYYEADESNPEHYMPRAIIMPGKEESCEMTSTTGFLSGGPVIVNLEFPTPEEYLASGEDAFLWFANTVGEIRQDVLRAHEDDPSKYLQVTKIETGQFGHSDRRKNNGEFFWGIELIHHWRGP